MASQQLRSEQTHDLQSRQGLEPTHSPSSYPLIFTPGRVERAEPVSADTHGSGGAGTEQAKNDRDGVRFCVVSGLGHHLQNHVEWQKGAAEIEDWVKML
jgi:hypothetical protein